MSVSLNTYLNMSVKAKRYQVPFFESLVWLDRGLNSGLPSYRQTFNPLGNSKITLFIIYHHHHHHHQVILTAKCFLTFSLAIRPYYSSHLAGIQGFILCPHKTYVSLYRSVNPGTSMCRSTQDNVAFQHCPLCLVRLTRMNCEIGGMWSYSCFFCDLLLSGFVYDSMQDFYVNGISVLAKHGGGFASNPPIVPLVRYIFRWHNRFVFYRLCVF